MSPSSMRVFVVGSGAREHALITAMASDDGVAALAAMPGNPGIASYADCLPGDIMDGKTVAAAAQSWQADLVVIGPEAPLVAGVADAVRAIGIACFGPSMHAAQLEGSKAFAKNVMAHAAIPTALAYVCHTLADVSQALDALGPPHVVKDDGLAAGKGVVVTTDRSKALSHAQTCLTRAAPPGSVQSVIVEEYLDGPEVSLFCISDGSTVVPLAPAQDFKRLGDGDAGPNTGGMGAYSPLPWATPTLADDIVHLVAEPTIAEMARRGTPFVGLLYIGLAITSHGPRVVEFNARFGDPETQVVLARLRTPLAGVLHAAATGRLADHPELDWSPDAAVTVVLAAPGYPEAVRKGGAITGLDAAAAVPGVYVLHAGTALRDNGIPSVNSQADAGSVAHAVPESVPDAVVVADGGRVLSIVGTGPDLAAARAVAYQAVAMIGLDSAQYRTDIAQAVAEAAENPGG